MSTAVTANSDSDALTAAMAELGTAIGELGRAIRRDARAPKRAALREKARTGMLKPLRAPSTPTRDMATRPTEDLTEGDADWVPLSELAAQNREPARRARKPQ